MRQQTPSKTERYRAEKKQDIEEAKAQKKIAKETEKDREKRAGDADAVRKHIVKFDKRQAKYEALISKDKDEENTAQPNSRSGTAFRR